MSATALLETTEATVVVDGRRLLDGVSLAFRSGEVTAILGENGAGKSTLIHLLAGDVVPDHGTVRLDGRPLADWSIRELARRRAVLPQSHALAFAFTALELTVLGRAPHHGGHPGPGDLAAARRALAATDALHLADRSVPSLSGGERSRVMLARVLAQIEREDGDGSETVLLLDEPTATLDLAHQHAAFAVLRGLAERGVAVVVVVHDPNLAARYADRVALLRDGRLLADGPTDEVLATESLSTCFGIRLVRIERPDLPGPVWVTLPDATVSSLRASG